MPVYPSVESLRELGQYWERQFCIMAGDFGKIFTPNQLDRQEAAMAYQRNGAGWNCYTLPDVVVWSAPGEHHEIKHKDPTRDYGRGRSYGLEVYRFNALLSFAEATGQTVLYTIHNHEKAGGRDVKENDISHWATANIKHLNNNWHTCRDNSSLVNGVWKTGISTYYWSIDLWLPLETFWKMV